MQNMDSRSWIKLFIIATAFTAIFASVSCIESQPINLAPIVIAGEATDISRTEATVSGEIRLQGEGKITFIKLEVWNSSDVEDGNVIPLSSTNLTPTIRLKNLTPGTQYHYMLKAGNNFTTIGSDTGSFSTNPNTKPSVDNTRILYAGITSCTASSRITDNGGENIASAGFIYWKKGTLQSSAKRVSTQETDAQGSFFCQINGLDRNSEYIIQAFAVQSAGEGSGSPTEFTTGSPAIHVPAAGTLHNILSQEEAKELIQASIGGDLNGDDIRYLREATKGEGNTFGGQLQYLNLTEARIVEGGMTYDGMRFTENDTIGTNMFGNFSSLKRVDLPNGTRAIMENAFIGCNALEYIHIPQHTAHIVRSSGCPSLKEIAVSPLNPHFSSEGGILLNKGKNAILWYPNGASKTPAELPSSITQIGEYAFAEYPHNTITLGNGITSIGNFAFVNSALEEISLPDNLHTIHTGLFQNSRKLHIVRMGSQTSYISDYFLSGTPIRELHIYAEPFTPYCTKNAFSGIDPVQCTVYVKKSMLKSYRNSSIGETFQYIKEIE